VGVSVPSAGRVDRQGAAAARGAAVHLGFSTLCGSSRSTSSLAST